MDHELAHPDRIDRVRYGKFLEACTTVHIRSVTASSKSPVSESASIRHQYAESAKRMKQTDMSCGDGGRVNASEPRFDHNLAIFRPNSVKGVFTSYVHHV